eukprot:m.347724 g.347724  ORF g.347724 m.347724 type:complete len:538 (+) comp33870_c0_seq1:124-1737(+)
MNQTSGSSADHTCRFEQQLCIQPRGGTKASPGRRLGHCGIGQCSRKYPCRQYYELCHTCGKQRSKQERNSPRDKSTVVVSPKVDSLERALPTLTKDLLKPIKTSSSIDELPKEQLLHVNSNTTVEENASVEESDIPHNLGWLGEKYAFEYFKNRFPNAEVKWINDTSESHADHDIELLTSKPLRHFEVKTRWRGCKLKRNELSSRQLARLLDPKDRYYIMIIGDFANLFQSTPLPPSSIRYFSTDIQSKTYTVVRSCEKCQCLLQRIHVDKRRRCDVCGVSPIYGPYGCTTCDLDICNNCLKSLQVPHRFQCVRSQTIGFWNIMWEPADHINTTSGLDLYYFKEIFESPRAFEEYRFAPGDSALCVTVGAISTTVLTRIYATPTMENVTCWYPEIKLHVALSVFNLISRQLCDFYETYKTPKFDEPYEVHVCLHRAEFTDKKDKAKHHLEKVTDKPHYYKVTRGNCLCPSCVLQSNAINTRLAEWNLLSGERSTGSKREDCVIGYHSSIPKEFRLISSHVRMDNIDNDKHEGVVMYC